jgi:hypothetical protein
VEGGHVSGELTQRKLILCMVFGGASFARSLAAHGLIDEYAWADGPMTQTYVPR